MKQSMTGMTTQERLDDICKRSGLSEDIVRRVFEAERESIAESLKRGERATLIGRCVIRPEIRTKMVIGGQMTTYVKLHCTVASSMEALLKDVTDFEVDEDQEDIPEGIITRQLSSLV